MFYQDKKPMKKSFCLSLLFLLSPPDFPRLIAFFRIHLDSEQLALFDNCYLTKLHKEYQVWIDKICLFLLSFSF